MTTHALTPVRFATDEDLMARVRAHADTAAAAELWVRYHPFGVRAAHVVRDRSDDAEFVAAEAFTALLGSLGHGAPVDEPFSLLLARRVSHAAAAPADATAHDDILDDPAAFDDPDAPSREPRADALEQSVLREAFAALPDDSRATMWHEVADRSDHGPGAPVAATRRAVARVRDDLRAMYVATLVSRDAVVPACRPYVTELPALVAGRETSSEAIVHAAGCHRCSSRVERLRELEYAVPSAVLPLLAPLTSGSTLPLLGALPAVDGAQLDIVPHAPTARALPPQQAARWMVGAGLAASVLAAATAIWWTTPGGDRQVAGDVPAVTSPEPDTAEPRTSPGTGVPGTGIDPQGVRPEVSPGVPPAQPPVTDPGEPTDPSPDDPPGTGGSSGPGRDPSPGPSSPAQTPDRPSTPTAPSSPPAPADPPAVNVAVTAAEGRGTAEVRAVAEGATEVEVTIDPPKKVKADKDAVASNLDSCKRRGGGMLVCTGAPDADGTITADVQLDWPEGVTGSVKVTVVVLQGDGTGLEGKGSSPPVPDGPTPSGADRAPSSVPTSPAGEDDRPPDTERDGAGPPDEVAARVIDEVRAALADTTLPAEVRAQLEAFLAELLARLVPAGD